MSDAARYPGRRWIRTLARIFLLIWVEFWLCFAAGTRLGEPATAEGLATLAIRGGAFRFAQGPHVLVRLILGGPPLAVRVCSWWRRGEGHEDYHPGADSASAPQQKRKVARRPSDSSSRRVLDAATL